MFNKKQIENNFNRSANAYDKYAVIQQHSAKFLCEFLLSSLPNLHPQSILDIGTGTGFTAAELLPHFPSAKYLLNDLSHNMLDLAMQKLGSHLNLLALPGDAELSDFPQTDLVVSNLTFQWFNGLEETITRLWQKTSSFAFATLIKYSFQEWYDYLNLPLHNHPTESAMIDLCTRLKPQQLKFYSRSYPIRFSNPIDCAKYFKNIGAATCLPKNYQNLTAALKANTVIDTAYHIFYAVLSKEVI